MKKLLALLCWLVLCGVALGQQSYVIFKPSPTGNPYYDTNLANVVISNVTFHGKVTFISNSNSPSLWNTNGAGLYTPSAANAQALQFGSNSTVSAQYAIVLGNSSGVSNLAASASVGGGSNNIINVGSVASVIPGGMGNSIGTTNIASVIGGGRENIIDSGLGQQATIGGGYQNRVRAQYGTVSGGAVNDVRLQYGFIGGGANNQTGPSGAQTHQVVVGGSLNGASGLRSFIGAGLRNVTDLNSEDSSVLGGAYNTMGALQAVIGGGIRNVNLGTASVIGGGETNYSASNWGFIGGGMSNAATSAYVSLPGGASNYVGSTALNAVLGGGVKNFINGNNAVIAGGGYNSVTAIGGAVLGGASNSVEAAYATAIGNFVTNSTTKSVEIGPDNASKTRFDVNGVTALKLITATNGFASYSSNLTAVTSVALSGTPALWTNTLTKNVQAVWSGGTVSGVAVNNSLWPTPAASGYAILQPGEWLAFTNTGVPEFAWKPF